MSYTIADYQKELDIVKSQALERLKKSADDLRKIVIETTDKIPDIITYYNNAHSMRESLRGLDRRYADYEHLHNLTVESIMQNEKTAQRYIKTFISQIQTADKLNRERLAKIGMTFPKRNELDINAFYHIYLTNYTIEWTGIEGNEYSISFNGDKNFSDMVRLNDYKITRGESYDRHVDMNYHSWDLSQLSYDVLERAVNASTD